MTVDDLSPSFIVSETTDSALTTGKLHRGSGNPENEPPDPDQKVRRGPGAPTPLYRRSRDTVDVDGPFP